jgi:predicted CoA-substrate-specific enzyme activase
MSLTTTQARGDSRSRILGIDIGSVSLSVAEIGRKREILNTIYRFHRGDIRGALREALNGFDLRGNCKVAATSSSPSILRANRRYDNRVAVMEAARHFHHDIGSILIVGGEAFGLIGFHENGRYRSFRTNTSCAAGTGSFLDQQARRLNLDHAAALSERACSNRGSVPKIASRCAVFSKTDLVHAQQEGYSLEQICDGLCYGLAKNIVDTLRMDRDAAAPILFTGGVSRNRAVVRHIESMTGKEVLVDDSGMYGAVGAAFLLAGEEHEADFVDVRSADDLLLRETPRKKFFHDPLELTLSHYPEFGGIETYEYPVTGVPCSHPVEVDIYEVLEPESDCPVFLGVDIGSTSTKAVLLDEGGRVLAGFYTATAGRPVAAVQRVFSAIEDTEARAKTGMRFLGAAATGSGRKFAGKIIGADIIIDEITAHARAACEINPEVDTIVEIGGQDSKFTTLTKGRVTFSIMNNVCAAGTGSFIEEQARKLGCPLAEYSSRTEGRRSPIVSDRCTVFMERDMNHYLSEGYAVDEVLASVLHAVRENYLTKVAVEGGIGNTVLFQGATAKNRSLVAAFEQRLKKPIHVSRYCHLTGALGAALTLSDQGIRKESVFRGTTIHRNTIEVSSETCELCTNHCKISVADLGDEKVAAGFLCGRDYDTKRYTGRNLSGFDLLKERKKIFSFEPIRDFSGEITVGLPAALHLHEDLHLWKRFFHALSIRTVTSEGYGEALKEGKHLAEAEFCAPMAALHGHVRYLMDRSDFVFLPFYLEKKAAGRGVRRQYCYYTQFSTSIISTSGEGETEKRLLTPLVHSLRGSFHTKIELYAMLKSIPGSRVGFLDVSRAYDKACEYEASCLEKWKAVYEKESLGRENLHVVLLGRPYTILSRFMNKGIPDIFASLGVRVFFQDMLSCSNEAVAPVRKLLDEIHWHYASEILKAAQVVAGSEGAYPVLVTSFRCSPDSFATDYFKNIMDSHEKPYLILQIDEHESSVGYETRIEAAVRTFENHYASKTRRKAAGFRPALFPVKERHLADRTLVIPNWDDLTLKLMVANLRREGIDARLMEETDTSIRKSLSRNTGQCIPLNVIAQEFADYVKRYDLDPAKTLLWMVSSQIACNIGLFPHHLKRLFHSYGGGLEKAGVYVGNMSFIDISLKLPINTYLAHLVGGFIRKIGCRLRPYEKIKGATDRVIKESMELLVDAFRGKRDKEEALADAISRFEAVEISRERKPKVAIFGDLYVRDNDVMNQDLIRFIERHNGEVIVTPYSAYVQMIVGAYLRKWFAEGRYLSILTSKALISTVTRMERTYHKHFGRLLENPAPGYEERPENILSEYKVGIEHTGESMDNLLKIFYIKRHYPDVSLFVQTSPAFCCPSLVTEAMAKRIEQRTGVPVVSITYDGTSGNKNEAVVPYLAHLNRKRDERE